MFQRRGHRSRAGQALVEFAFILFIVVFLFGGALSLGYFFYSAQSLQTAVDVAAHEIARMPFGPTATFEDVLDDDRFRAEIYDEQYLILSIGQYMDPTLPLPLLNRLLRSVMILDPAYDPYEEGGVYRYPGAIVRNVSRDIETVRIPLLDYDEFGQETLINWIAPVEEILVPPVKDSQEYEAVGQFSVLPPSVGTEQLSQHFLPGVVGIRINFPAQAATIVQRRDRSLGIGMGPPISGDDFDVVEEAELPSNYELVIEPNVGNLDGTPRIHAGRYGLGRQAAYYQELGVRPYRRIISVEAIYRREVFGAVSDPEDP